MGFFSFKTTAEYFRHLLKKGYAQDEMHIKRRLRALVSGRSEMHIKRRLRALVSDVG